MYELGFDVCHRHYTFQFNFTKADEIMSAKIVALIWIWLVHQHEPCYVISQ